MSRVKGTKRITYDQLDSTLKQIVADYCDDIERGLENTIKQEAEICKNEIVANSQSHGWSDYASGWAVKDKGRGSEIVCIIHNKTHYRLAHLLEKSHVMIAHGKVLGMSQAVPHIAPAEKKAVKETEKKVKEMIRRT